MNRIVHRRLTLARLTTRSAGGAIIALLLALVVTSPAAAAQPTRTVHDDLSGFTIRAGSACAFDVQGQPSFGFTAKTVFSDGRIMYSVHAHGAYVNAVTNTRYPTIDNFQAVEWDDPVTGNAYVVLEGQGASWFLPGDTGPFGTVGPNGAFYDFVGRITFTIDATGATTQFSWVGTVTDICAALS